MIDKVLEEIYYTRATDNLSNLEINNNEAIYITGVAFGLEARENEVAELKARIQELETLLNL